MSTVTYPKLFEGSVGEYYDDGQGQSRILDLTTIAANGRQLSDLGDLSSLTVEVNLSGSGPGYLPTIVIEAAAAIPGRKPARPGTFETIASTGKMDSGSWSQTFAAGEFRRFLRARWVFMTEHYPQYWSEYRYRTHRATGFRDRLAREKLTWLSDTTAQMPDGGTLTATALRDLTITVTGERSE